MAPARPAPRSWPGYARNTGKLGVCCSTTGPGATNLITGVASAFENQIPMLVITPHTPQSHFGRKALPESSDTAVDTVAMFQHCTHYNTMVSHIDQLEHKLASAIMTAFNSSGPAHISVPLDVMRAQVRLRLTTTCPRCWRGRLEGRDRHHAASPCCSAAGGGVRAGKRLPGRRRPDLHGHDLHARVTTPDGRPDPAVVPATAAYSPSLATRAPDRALRDRGRPRDHRGQHAERWGSNWDRELPQQPAGARRLERERFTRSPMARLHVRGSIDTIFELIAELGLWPPRRRRRTRATDERRRGAALRGQPFREMPHTSCPIKPSG
jgi:acetolactate synthase-1/2/3 large subunit